MSRIAEQLERSSFGGLEQSFLPALSKKMLLMVLAASFIHGFIAYSVRPFDIGVPSELFLGTINFVIVVFLFFGFSTLIYYQKRLLLVLVAAPGIILSLLAARSDMSWVAVAGWSALIAPSLICGRLAFHNYPISKIFSVSVIVLVLFGSLQMIPIWQTMASSESIAELILETEPVLSASGYSAEQAEQIKEFLAFFLRVLPALTIMSIIMQFALGFWIFTKWQTIRGNINLSLPHFNTWRMPFSFTPVILLGVLMRLFGSDLTVIIADNLLLLLAMFYSLTGLSLLRFIMHKAQLSIFLKLMVYLGLFLFQVIGLVIMALAGFADSFFDWRRKYPLPIGFK